MRATALYWVTAEGRGRKETGFAEWQKETLIKERLFRVETSPGEVPAVPSLLSRCRDPTGASSPATFVFPTILGGGAVISDRLRAELMA